MHRFLAGQELAQRLGAIWPADVVDGLHAVSLDDAATRIQGLIGDPAMAQARPDRILVYVNSRPVQDKTMLAAIREAYRGRILGKEYPQAVIFLEIPPDEVDVNVHPAKTEVRFQDESAIFRAVRRAVLQTLERDGHHAPPADHAEPMVIAQLQAALPVMERHFSGQAPRNEGRDWREDRPSDQAWPEKFASSTAAQKLFEAADHTYEHAARPTPPPPAQPTPKAAAAMRYMGQFAQTYLVLASSDEITLIDQHAAHERVLFNMLRASGSRGDRSPLLMPLEIPLHPAQLTAVQEIWTQLDGLGFCLEIAPGPTLLLRSVPALLTQAKAREFLQDVLNDKATTMDDLWAVMACKAAIKAGDALTADEALALVDAWQRLPEKNFCPHGRPVAVRWGVNDLEKMFKRRS